MYNRESRHPSSSGQSAPFSTDRSMSSQGMQPFSQAFSQSVPVADGDVYAHPSHRGQAFDCADGPPALAYSTVHPPPYNSAPYPHYYPSPSYGNQTPPPAQEVCTRSSLSSFLRNQKVEVRIRANTWVVGIIISTLAACSKFIGLGFEVEYVAADTGRRRRDTFPPSDIRPL